MSCQQKITIYQGATWLYEGTLKDDNGDPVNLTGYSFQGSIKKTPTDTPINFNFEILDQVTNTGKFNVFIPASGTAAIPVDAFDAPSRPLTKYLGDMEIIYPDNTIWRFFEFIAYVSPAVTED